MRRVFSLQVISPHSKIGSQDVNHEDTCGFDSCDCNLDQLYQNRKKDREDRGHECNTS